MRLLNYIDNQLYRKFFKRILDFFISFFMIIILSPILITISILVKLTSKGPVIYRRKIVGKGGRIIFAYKFRTMVVDAEKLLKENPKLYRKFREKHKLENDFRTTPFGFFLRKFSLDELPQFFNVLKGEMSVVGPRMIHPDELEKYGAFAAELQTFRPAMTGYWQVNGRQNTSYDQRVQMDMFYIRNCSLSLDLKILFITPFTVLQAEGAQ